MAISVSGPGSLPGLAAPVRALVRLTLSLEGRRAGEVGVRLARDAELRELNRRWRGIDRATDVLSFAYDAEPGRTVSGDLVISLDRLVEQARRYRVRRGHELARLVVHGALHLVGHDHHRVGERRRMRRAEGRALRSAWPLARRLEPALGARLDRLLIGDV
jgi:probable rRNA maturation factor